MNGVQKNYRAAKAAFLVLEEEMDRKERDFLKGKGRTENRIYAVEDEAVFNHLNEEFASLTKGAWNRLVSCG